MTTHAMIDLETLSVVPQGQILTIGAVKFDPYSRRKPFDHLYLKPDIDEQESRGRVTDESVLEWWSGQAEEVILEAFSMDDRISVSQALSKLKKWYVGCEGVWTHGNIFDISMLEDIHRQWDYPVPWAFWSVRDSRTLFNLLPQDPRKQFEYQAHHALEDARVQAMAVQYAFKELGLSRG